MADITRRDPFGINSNLRSAMERIFEDPFFRTGFMSEEGTLPLDIAENDKEIVVRADLPGYSKDQLYVVV